MALARDPSPALCYDEPLFIDVSLTGIVEIGQENLHHPKQLMEECTVGIHPWELPMVAADISSSSPSSSVITFDGHGEEYCAASMDDNGNCFTFGGDGGGSDLTAAAATEKRPRAYAPSQIAEEEAVAAPKKHCGGDNRMAATTKQPNKNRREGISERLRALQELVPSGSKVDTVTMLDKAITYVKFMQPQLKVLETDAFWPAPGGEAPKMSQVKEALDAILRSAPFS
ncbi:hypothetical protein HU200_060013 [Digitaria exilis]|uniref:BHLH domain-containing protein n=1 Tax=Digitaria exilis TaxID=1010633 RepID=A0A835AA88_9POAL|nr:hypothetical protein HU200_060013 [Digitaria exilis]